MDDGKELLLKQRRARALMESVEKVEDNKLGLEESNEELIEHLHEMKREDF